MRSRILKFVCLLTALNSFERVASDSNAFVDASTSGPIVVSEGQDALITCITRHSNENNHVIIWRKDTSKVLLAGPTKIVRDDRISLIHDDGGDVYVLAIKKVTPDDSGTYTCEINTEPPSKSIHQLSVIKKNSSIDVWGYSTESPVTHDYTSCCSENGVSKDCLGFCSIKNIMEVSDAFYFCLPVCSIKNVS